MKKILGLAVAAGAVCAFGADKVVQWDAEATPAVVAAGTVGLSYDGSAVKTLAASNALNDRVVFEGDAMSLASDAELRIGPGAVAFSNAVNAAGNVRFSQELPNFAYGSYKTGVYDENELAWQISTPARKVLDGMRLEDVEVFSGSFAGSQVSTINQGLVMAPYHVVRTDGMMTVQMQVKDGSWDKCVKLRFTQGDDGVYAETLYARFGEIGIYPLGNDFDQFYKGTQGIGNATTWGSYAVKGLTFTSVASKERFTVAKPFMAGGAVAATNVEVTVTGKGELGPSVGVAAPLSLSGATLSVTNREVSVLTFKHKIAGENSSLVLRQPSAGGEAREVRVEKSVKGNWVTVAENAALVDVMDISAPHMIQDSGTINMGEGEAHFFVKRGDVVTCQLQVHNNEWNKAAILEIRQNGMNLEARVAQSYWQHYAKMPYGTDLTTNYYGTASGASYYPDAFTMRLVTMGMMVMANSTNSLKDSSIVVGTNVSFNVNVKGALPASESANSTLEVEAGGALNLNVYGSNESGLNGGTVITVRKGGVMNQVKPGAFSQSQKVVLDGGLLAFSSTSIGSGGNWDSATYLNYLTFRDGALTTGMGPRVGAHDAVWTVSGTGEACSHSAGAVLVNTLNVGDVFVRQYVWNLAVEDVTGDARPDFLFGGHVADYSSSADTHYYGVTRRKTGAGTMRIVPETWSISLTGRWEIVEGKLQVGANDVFSAARGYELALKGGTLEIEAGVSNSFAFFTDLTADSAIALGDGAALDLPGAPANWTEGKKLAVTLGEGALLRFGADKTSLTPAQLALVRVNGEKAKLDDNGYLKPRRFGTALMIR